MKILHDRLGAWLEFSRGLRRDEASGRPSMEWFLRRTPRCRWIRIGCGRVKRDGEFKWICNEQLIEFIHEC
jgi:hypothetical protein